MDDANKGAASQESLNLREWELRPRNKQILADYQRSLPTERLQILRVLQRLNMAWYGHSGGSGRAGPRHYPIPEHRDTVTSDEAFGRYLGDVYTSPFFYRMNFIRQLSTVPITTHLDGTHSRLSHALGATKVAAELLHSMEKEKRGSKRCGEPGQIFSEFERTACLFYCFIHDVFHGPFGHTLDMMKDVFHPVPKSKKLDDYYLHRALDSVADGEPSPEGRELLTGAERVTDGDSRGHELLQLVRTLSWPRDRIARDESCRLVALKDVVDSALDADRIDYICRDSYHLLDTMGRTRYDRLVDEARTVEDENGWLRLGYHASQEPVVADILGDRQRLYTDYYEAVDKLVVDDMLCHALYYVLRDLGVLHRTDEDRSRAEQIRQRLLHNIMVLTDSDLIAFLREAHVDDGAYILLRKVRRHDYYEPVYVRAFRFKEVPLVQQYAKQWRNVVGGRLWDLGYLRDEGRDVRTTGQDSQEIREKSDKVLRQYTEERGNGGGGKGQPEDVLIYNLQYFLNGSFKDQLDFEHAIWERLSGQEGFRDWMVDFGLQEHGHSDWFENVGREHLERYRPLHVTVSSFFGPFGKKEWARMRKEGGESASEVYFYEETGSVAAHEVKPAARESTEAYPFIVSAPKSLLEAVDPEEIRQVVMEELRSCDWVWRSLKSGSHAFPDHDTQ